MKDAVSAALAAIGVIAFIGLWLFGDWLLPWLFFELRDWWRTRGSGNWPQVEGIVETANWHDRGQVPEGWMGAFWAMTAIPPPMAKITYSYKVEGEWYANVYERTFTNADRATDFVLQIRGRKVLVRYRPGKPEKSIVSQVLGS